MCFLSFVYSERLVRQLSIWNADGLVLDSNRFLIPPNSSVTD